METPQPSTPPVKPRRRRRLLLLAGGVIFLMLLLWLAPVLVGWSGFRHRIAQGLFPDLQGTITVGSASLGWFSPIILEDVVVRGHDGQALLNAGRIESSRSLLDLLRRRSTDLGSFRFDHPVLKIVFHKDNPDKSNLETICGHWFAPPKTVPAERLAFRVEWVDARIEVRDEGQKKPFTLEPVHLVFESPRFRSDPMSLAFQGEWKEGNQAGKMDIAWNQHEEANDGQFRSKGELMVKAEAMPLGVLAPLVRRLEPDSRLAGRLDGRLDYRWGQGQADDGRLEGSLTIRDLALAGPWLDKDRLYLKKLDAPYQLIFQGDQVRIDQARLECDLGHMSAQGTFNSSMPLWADLSRPGYQLAAEVDLARLAAALPHLVRLRQRTAISQGRLNVKLQSVPYPGGVAWNGNLNASDLNGKAGGQPIVWQAPLSAVFKAHQVGKALPVVDQLRCDSGFLQLQAAGSAGQWTATANYDLDRLAAELSRFIDLGSMRLAGKGWTRLTIQNKEGKAFKLDGESRFDQLQLAWDHGPAWKESALDLRLQAVGKSDASGRHDLDAAGLRLQAGADEAELQLLEPASNLEAGLKGKLKLHVHGDLDGWRSRLELLTPALHDWKLAGYGDLNARLDLFSSGLDFSDAELVLRAVRCTGPGLWLAEPAIDAKATGHWQPDGKLEIKTGLVTSPALSVRLARVKVISGKDWLLTGAAGFQADLARLGRWFHDPAAGAAEPPRGLLAGQGQFQQGPKQLELDLDLNVRDLAIGPATAPTWRETLLKLKGQGILDSAGDSFRIDKLQAQSSLGECEVQGQIDHWSRTRDLTLAGKLHYDLAKLEPYLRPYLGKEVKLTGQDTRPFRLSGALAARPTAPGLWSRLKGEAALGWTSLEAHGVVFSPADLQARLEDGWLRFQPITGTVNQGRYRLEPSLHLDPAPAEIVLAKGSFIDHARITPAMCASALGYAAPALAGAARAEGQVSLALERCRFPVADPNKADMAGRITLHSARIGPGPLIRELGILLKRPTEASLTKEAVIPFKVAGGRVYHDKLELVFPGLTIRTSGSVGLDGSLDLTAELPIPPKWVGQLPLGSALAKQTIRLPIAGTLEHPRLDPAALRAASERFLRDLGKEVLRKELKKKLKNLFKR